MNCEKTGGWTYLKEYGSWVYGDIYTTENGTIVVRVINMSGNASSQEPSDVWAEITVVGQKFTDTKMVTYIADRGRMLKRYDVTPDGVAEVLL